jgi:hypothetical protein
VGDPGVALVEVDDRQDDVEGVDDRLEGGLLVALVSRGQLVAGGQGPDVNSVV